jgi:hypothetical protein
MKLYRLKTLSTLIFALLLTSKCLGQTYNAVITDEEIVGFINWHLSTQPKFGEEPKHGLKKIFYKISKWDTANFFPDRIKDNSKTYIRDFLFYKNNKWLDTVFSNNDREFLFIQFNSQLDTVWRHKFKNSKLLKTKKQGRDNRYYLTLPLFSLDRKYVIIREIYYCGSLCAHGAYKIFRRRNDEGWEFIGSLYEWIS